MAETDFGSEGGSGSGGTRGRGRAASAQAETMDDYEAIKRDLSDLREDVSALVSHMRAGAGSAVERVTERASRQIDERPLTSLAVAFIAGFLTSRFLR
jgi:hypothetical protein